MAISVGDMVRLDDNTSSLHESLARVEAAPDHAGMVRITITQIAHPDLTGIPVGATAYWHKSDMLPRSKE